MSPATLHFHLAIQISNRTNNFLSLSTTLQNLLEVKTFLPGRRMLLRPPEDGIPPSVPMPGWLSLLLSYRCFCNLISKAVKGRHGTASADNLSYGFPSLAVRASPNMWSKFSLLGFRTLLSSPVYQRNKGYSFIWKLLMSLPHSAPWRSSFHSVFCPRQCFLGFWFLASIFVNNPLINQKGNI